MQLEFEAVSQAARSPGDAGLLGRTRRLLGSRMLLAATAVAALLLVALFVHDLQTADTNDFRSSYTAAQALRHGERLYSTALAWKRTGYASGLQTDLPTSAYVYPPAVAIAFAPLTVVPYRAARDLWLTLIFAALVGDGILLAGLLSRQSAASTLVFGVTIAGASALLAPVRITLAAGQIDPLLLFLILLGVVAVSRRRWRRAAALFAVAACIKPFLLFVALILIWKGAYRAALLAGALAGALILLPAAALGAGTVRDFLSVLQYFSSATFAVSPHNQALSGMLLRLFTRNPFTAPIVTAPALATVLRYALSVAVLGLLAAVALRRRGLGEARDLLLDLALLLCGMLLISPHTEVYHLTYLLPVVAAVAAALLHEPARRRAALALALLLAAASLTLPGLDSAQYAFHDYLHGPVTMPRLLLTGDLLYGVLALSVVAFLAALRRPDHGPAFEYRQPERTS
jgi:hypothetical protein